MSTINVSCIDQVLNFTNMPVITAGDKNIDKVQFDFCPLWDGFVKVAVFFQQKNLMSFAVVNVDGSCNIPNSILELTGKIYLSVTGINPNNEIRTSNIVAYDIDDGVINKGLQDDFPSEEEQNDIFSQMLELCQNATSIYEDMKNNMAYVRVEGVNEFEYDESKIEAKIAGYTASLETQITSLSNKLDLHIAEFESHLVEFESYKDEITQQLNSLESDLVNRISTLRTDIESEIQQLKDKIDQLS